MIASYPAGEGGYFIVQFSGPIRAEWKEYIKELGGALSWYIPDYAFLVKMDPSIKTIIQSLPFVRWIGIYQPAYKIHPDLLGRGAAEPVTIKILTPDIDCLNSVMSEVSALGGEVLGMAGGGIKAQVRASEISRLAAMNDVVWIEPWYPRIAFNDTARWVIQSGTGGFAPIHDNGIHGENQVVTIADTGLRVDSANRPSHEMFVDPGKTTGPEHRKVHAYYIPLGAGGAIGDESGHGTHVAGTVAGDAGTWGAYDNALGSSGKHDGQAFAAQIVMQDIDYSSDVYVYPPDDYNNLFQPAYDIGSVIHTNSWGGGSGYDAWTQMIDNFMWSNKNFQILFAMGNAGLGTRTLSSEPEAKNAISVGATLNGASADSIASWSSRGLASDNRIKPTVVAPGVGIWSADYSGDNLYAQMSGTSMATPTVAGAVALIEQYYSEGWYLAGEKKPANAFEPSSALIRATLINGAIEINGSGAYQNSNMYPNGDQGWGRVDLNNSLYFKGDAKRMWVVDNALGVATGQTATYQIQVSDNTQPLKFTLAWTDYPGSPNVSVQLVNDLNLKVTDPNGNVYLGNVFTSYNPGYSTIGGSPDNRNVEEAVLLLPDNNKFPTGTYTVDVMGYNVPNGEAGTDAQPFALVVTGGIADSQSNITPTQRWTQTNWERGPAKPVLQTGTWNRAYFDFYDNENVNWSLPGKIKLVSFGVPVTGIADHVVISEFATKGPSGIYDEFIELYNPTSSTVEIGGWNLQYYTGTAWSSTLIATFPSGAKIPAYGFYLWANNHDNYTGPTLDYSTNYNDLADGAAGSPRGIRLRNASNTVIDTVVYEGNGNISNSGGEGEVTAPNAATSPQSVERKSGPDNLPHYENLGNGRDTNNNFNDWYRRTTRQPQNSASSIELPLGVAFKSAGFFESSIFDAGRAVDWKKVTWIESKLTGTGIVVKVRTGNDNNPYDGGWSDWYRHSNSSENISMPDGRYAQYRVELSTTDNTKTPELSEIMLNYEVIARSVEVSISPSYQSGQPGENLDYFVTVFNFGNVEDNYDLTVSDNADWTLKLSDNLLENVSAGENRTTTLHVTISSSATGGTLDNAWVKAASKDNSAVFDNKSCTAQVTISRSVSVSISPTTQSGVWGSTLTYTVTVSNTGNVSDTYTLENTDTNFWTTTSLSKTSVGPLAPFGGSDSATLSVTIPISGTDDNITVTATSQTDNTVENSAICIAQVVPGSVYNVNKGTWYTTIQSGVDNADPGNTIFVYPGTFDEQVVIDKSLTLEGSGDSTVVKPSSENELTSLYTYPENLPYMGGKKVASIILVENAGGTSVTIENLKVDGSSVTTLPAGANILAGILYGESGGKIQNVTVDNIKTTGYADRTYGIDLAATGSAVSVEVSNNRINDWARNGINANGAGLTVNIHGNTLTGPSIPVGPTQVPNGIVLWADLVGTVSGNTISSCHFIDSDTSYRSVGIMGFDVLGPSGVVIENNEMYDVDEGVNPSTNCIIRNNNLHGDLSGVDLEMGADNNQIINNNIWNNVVGIQINGELNPNPQGVDPPTANNFAHFNIISGNTSGVVNYDDTQKFDARFNWWGNASGPGGVGPGTGDNITENVLYSPWLGFTVGNVPMTFHVDNTGTIQSAVDVASSGDTIIVHSGTYGPFTVNGKSNLTIKAASVPIVEGVQSVSTNYGDRDTVVFVKNSTNIVLEGLDIEGNGLGTINLKNQCIIYENSSGTIENCKVSPNTVGDMNSRGIGIWDGSNVTIDSCVIENFGRIGVFIYNGCTVGIYNSTIIGQVYNDINLVNYGIEVEGAYGTDEPATACNVTIRGNEIYNCNNLASSPLWTSDAISINGWLESMPEADSTVVIESNDIHNNYIGIEVCKSPSSYAHFNSIHNNLTYGVLNVNAYDDTSATFNATCNWWGDASGPYNPTTNPSGLGDGVSDNVTCVGWARAPIGTVWIDVSPASLSGSNGATLNYTVTVQNTDNVSHTFNLTDNAGPSWLPSFVENSLTIPPNENGTATFSVTVPSGLLAGTIYNMTVTATSQDNGSVSASASCTAEVTVTRGVSVSISPTSQSGENGATLTYTVTVTNTGNVSDTYTLENTDTLGWTKSLSKTLVGPLSPSAFDNTTTLSVTIPENAIGGATDTITVKATGTGDNASASCTAVVTTASETLTLVAGWNLVGFPLVNTNSTPNNLFAGKSFTMYYWNAPYGPYTEPDYSQPVKDNIGYWVKINEDTTITLSGARYSSRTMYFVAGWNLVSFPLTSASTTPNNLFAGKSFTMYYWNAPYGPYTEPDYSQPVKDNIGYWVKINTDYSVTIPL